MNFYLLLPFILNNKRVANIKLRNHYPRFHHTVNPQYNQIIKKYFKKVKFFISGSRPKPIMRYYTDHYH
jgi:hypothetical protein